MLRITSRVYGLRLGVIALVAYLCVAPSLPSALAGNHLCKPGCGHPIPQPCPPPCPPPPTILTAGPSPENLQVHIVGDDFGTIEAYFKEELYRETLPGATNLQCNNSVLLAPISDFGTFAVRFGPYYDTFKVFGWRKTDTASPVWFGPITLEPGCPIAMQWVTPQILKVTYGPNCSKEFILKFTDGDDKWRVLYSSDPVPLPQIGRRSLDVKR